MSIDLPSTQTELVLTPETIRQYRLADWAREFSLMTAGYRDRLDPDDPNNPAVAFNSITLAILAEAKAQVFEAKRRPGGSGDVHVGGEVRPNTAAFISVLARVYAAHGLRVHLRRDVRTTPIWYSSFGIFYEEMESGENLTASHSPFFKGGWKPLDDEGKQLTSEEPALIRAVRELVASGATVRLAPREAAGILSDFDIDAPYVDYQQQVFGPELFESIRAAHQRGFTCLATPLGGSMGATTRRLFRRLRIPIEENGAVRYFLDEENERFHRVGEIGGENLGADPSKKEICRNLGVAGALLRGEADAVFVWDPDGDRFNIITATTNQWVDRARALGLDAESSPQGDAAIVYFTPNQLYLLLIAHRIALLKSSGKHDGNDWFVGMSYPTSKAIEEFVTQQGVPVVRVPTGFKNLGDLCRRLESQSGGIASFESVTGERTEIGARPRALFLCEESGGATMGAADLLTSRHGTRRMLALREKDGFQVALMTLGLAADLHSRKASFAQAYCELVDGSGIEHPYAGRRDVLLYDEALMGDEMREAKAVGVKRRDRVVEFFRELADGHRAGRMTLKQVTEALADECRSASKLPAVKDVAWIGDGTMIEMEGVRLIVRASGTDALLRYYFDAANAVLLDEVADAALRMPR